MDDLTIIRYYLRRSGGCGNHPGKLEARIMRHPGRRARVLKAFESWAKHPALNVFAPPRENRIQIRHAERAHFVYRVWHYHLFWGWHPMVMDDFGTLQLLDSRANYHYFGIPPHEE